MVNELHIVNGKSSLSLLSQTELSGAFVSGDDLLAHGRLSRDCTESFWRDRAEWLNRMFDVPVSAYMNRYQQNIEVLERISRSERIVLWFEFDLHCQINLMFWLKELSASAAAGEVSLICPRELEGHPDFRGLGELSAGELEALYRERTTVTKIGFSLAERAWDAFSNEDPSGLLALTGPSEDLPCLAAATNAHLERFPGASGLGAFESRLLATAQRLGDGASFAEFFPQVSRGEPVFGFGDLQIAGFVRRLASTDKALLRLDGDRSIPGGLPSWRISTSQYGASVLAGDESAWDYHRLVNRAEPFWLGGVRFDGVSAWAIQPGGALESRRF